MRFKGREMEFKDIGKEMFEVIFPSPETCLHELQTVMLISSGSTMHDADDKAPVWCLSCTSKNLHA